jgi:Zn-finger nucleic acid-binding protein
MFYKHGSPKPEKKKARQMPDQSELQFTRKCKHCDISLITFSIDKIQLRACLKCGALFASDWGLDEIHKRGQEIDDLLDFKKFKEREKARLSELSRNPERKVSRWRRNLANWLNPQKG